jgi:hypothetical protein
MQWLTASFLILAMPFAFGSPEVAAASVAVRSVEVEGTAFRVTLSDGRIIAQDQLPGTILMLGDGSRRQRRIRIDGVEHDGRDAAGEIVLYALSEQDPASGEWRNLCLPDPDGRRLGFPLAGAFTPDGRYEPTHRGFSSPAPAAPRENASASAISLGVLDPIIFPLHPTIRPASGWSAPIIAVTGPAIHAMARRSIFLTRSASSATSRRRE